MRVRVVNVRINETGERIRPPVPIDITSLFEIDHVSNTVVYRDVQVEELYPLWGGLDMVLADVALTEEGKPDATVEFRIFQTPTSTPAPEFEKRQAPPTFAESIGAGFQKTAENLKKIDVAGALKRMEELTRPQPTVVVGLGPRAKPVRLTIDDILPGMGFTPSGTPFIKAKAPWFDHTRAGGRVGPGKRKKGKRKKGKKK